MKLRVFASVLIGSFLFASTACKSVPVITYNEGGITHNPEYTWRKKAEGTIWGALIGTGPGGLIGYIADGAKGAAIGGGIGALVGGTIGGVAANSRAEEVEAKIKAAGDASRAAAAEATATKALIAASSDENSRLKADIDSVKQLRAQLAGQPGQAPVSAKDRQAIESQIASSIKKFDARSAQLDKLEEQLTKQIQLSNAVGVMADVDRSKRDSSGATVPTQDDPVALDLSREIQRAQYELDALKSQRAQLKDLRN